MQTKGLEIEMQALSKLEVNASRIAAQSLYKAAGILADEYRRAAESIPTEKYRFVRMYGPPADPPRHATVAEKNAVVGAIGIARFRNTDDEVNTSIGIGTAGYATNIRTKQYPNGKPIPLIANAINSGAFYMVKYPFARKAEAAGKAKALAALEQEANKLIDEVTNNG